MSGGRETRAVSPSPSLSRLKFLFPCNFVVVQGQAAAAGIVTVQVGVTVRWGCGDGGGGSPAHRRSDSAHLLLPRQSA